LLPFARFCRNGRAFRSALSFKAPRSGALRRALE
jgi:hypothetical protein